MRKNAENNFDSDRTEGKARIGSYATADLSLILISVFIILSCFVPYIGERMLGISLWNCAENEMDYILLICIIVIAVLIGSCTLIHCVNFGKNFVIIEFILIIIMFIYAHNEMKYVDFEDLSIGFYMLIISEIMLPVSVIMLPGGALSEKQTKINEEDMRTYESADYIVMIASVFVILSCFLPYINVRYWKKMSLWECAEKETEYLLMLLVVIIGIAVIIDICVLTHYWIFGVFFVIIEVALIAFIVIYTHNKMNFTNVAAGYYLFIISAIVLLAGIFAKKKYM